MAKKKHFTFEGFRYPTYTQVPDEVFDKLMPDLTESELKCLLYIIRRTFGFKKDSDSISAKQFIKGIVTKDGRQLDRGTGLSSKGVWSGLKGLEEKNIIEAERKLAPDGDYEINVYRLCFAEGVSTPGRYPYYQRKKPVTTSGRIQHTVLQETVKQQTEIDESRSKSKIEGTSTSSTFQSSENISRLITDLSKQILHDPKHIESNIAQAHNIWHESGLSEEEFAEALYEAKRITLEWSGNIRKLANEKTGLKNRAPYFFQVLRSLILLEES